ncbi:hypothetical protein F1880_001276 [Penicillium rolfsii]|nr:hypothetical protein F1880_001276 [Penicillium rolfsii]
MGQRTKVLDIEGPTPKFLYAIIKQLNLKDIDWNKVALDLEISNGHAARMRYSRFKSQIDPSTLRGKKKNAKKLEKNGLKGEFQTPPTMPHPSFSEQGVVKLEPTGSPFQPNPNPFGIKFECSSSDAHGMQGPSNPPEGFCSPFTQLMSPAQTMTSSRMMPPRYIEQLDPISYGTQPEHAAVGRPFLLASGTYAPVPISNTSAFATYPNFPMPQDFHIQDFPGQTPGFHSGPVIPWEPAPQQQSESALSPMTIKEEPGSCEKSTESVVIKEEQVSADKISVDIIPDCETVPAAKAIQIPQDPIERQEMAIMAMCLRKIDPITHKVDSAAVAEAFGYSNPKSIGNRWGVLKKKYGIQVEMSYPKAASSPKVSQDKVQKKRGRKPAAKASEPKIDDDDDDTTAEEVKVEDGKASENEA